MSRHPWYSPPMLLSHAKRDHPGRFGSTPSDRAGGGRARGSGRLVESRRPARAATCHRCGPAGYGCGDSLISQGIADQLDLDVFGARDVFGVGGTISVSGRVCMVRLFFGGMPAALLADAAPVIAVPSLNHLGARMILGRDVLSRCVVIYNGPHSSCTFAF